MTRMFVSNAHTTKWYSICKSNQVEGPCHLDLKNGIQELLRCTRAPLFIEITNEGQKDSEDNSSHGS